MTKLRLFGNVILDTLIAVFGPAVLESGIPHRAPHSGAEIIWRVWITSIVIASVLGVLVTRYRSSRTGMWAWLIPATVFAVRALLYVSGRSTGFASHFSGYDCAIGLQKSHCNDFLGVTLPFIRGLFYSTTALLTLRVLARGTNAEREAI